MLPKLWEKCGVIGVWGNGDAVNELVYSGLYGVQHRGQQSAGVAFVRGGEIVWHKDLGFVSEIFDERRISQFAGAKAGLGHCGYITASESSRDNVQPFVFKYVKGQFAISYNGCLLNADELRAELEEAGYVFRSGSDAEIISILIAKARTGSHKIEKALGCVMGKLVGAYSILLMTPRKIVAARDARGMKPLCIGRIGESIIVASETSALNMVNAEFERDVLPGEIVVISDDGIESVISRGCEKTAMCIFEHVYLARTDSVIDGMPVYNSRFEAGRALAAEKPVKADAVMGVPDSGIAAALGYSEASGIQYTEGLVKNRYIARTFIQPSQTMRENAVSLKLAPIRNRIEGKSVVLVDDSIVRGTTCRKIVSMLKRFGGAKEIHVRISSPTVKYPCLYGIDTRDADALVANQMGVDGMCDYIGADSLAFLSESALDNITIGSKSGFCKACFNGEYPLVFNKGEK